MSSPSNPTGAMLSPEELKALCDACSQHNITFISDEIYHGITYGTQKEATAAEFSESVIVVNSFSKFYSMTGAFIWISNNQFISQILLLRHDMLALTFAPYFVSTLAGSLCFIAMTRYLAIISPLSFVRTCGSSLFCCYDTLYWRYSSHSGC